MLPHLNIALFGAGTIGKSNGEIMNVLDNKMVQLIKRYVPLEKEIQKLARQACHHYCEKCSSRCCREEMCRESIESPFLAMLVEDQGLQYETRKGWMGPSGCMLPYGRPLVCYEFFCDNISRHQSFRDKKIIEIINDFTAIGARARGSKHLLCIEELGIISSAKTDKMISKISMIMSKLADFQR